MRDMNGNGSGQIAILSLRFAGGSKENHEELSKDGRCSNLDINQAPPKYKSKVLSLNHHAQYPAFTLYSMF
jgi:hypothetical protein